MTNLYHRVLVIYLAFSALNVQCLDWKLFLFGGIMASRVD